MKVNATVLRADYDSKIADFQFLIETVKFILQKEISRNKIKIHSFTHRIKTFDSFLDKIRRKNITKPFKEIHDLVGLRIVCLFLPDLEILRDIIRKEFDIFEEDNKVDNSELDIFGYMSLHYKAKLKVKSSSQGLNSIQETPFEIQVRTIAQDAWASISHYLDYKLEPDNPIFYLRISNVGKTAANDLKLSLDKPFYPFGEKKEDNNLAECFAFKNVITSFPPGS